MYLAASTPLLSAPCLLYRCGKGQVAFTGPHSWEGVELASVDWPVSAWFELVSVGVLRALLPGTLSREMVHAGEGPPPLPQVAKPGFPWTSVPFLFRGTCSCLAPCFCLGYFVAIHLVDQNSIRVSSDFPFSHPPVS